MSSLYSLSGNRNPCFQALVLLLFAYLPALIPQHESHSRVILNPDDREKNVKILIIILFRYFTILIPKPKSYY